MSRFLIELYVFLFARTRFERLNKFLYRLSLGGMGILNYETSKISGEKSFLENYFANQSGVLLDVGANKGGYSLEALRANSELKIYAFEPHPITYSSLAQIVSKHSNVLSINKGLSSASGTLRLYDHSNEDGSQHATLFKDVITEIHKSSSVVEHEVEVMTLDDFLKIEKISEVALLKIDTEGNELEVLRGGAKAIAERRIKAIHFEFNEMNVVSRVFLRDFFEILEGYRFYRLLPNEMLEIRSYNPLSCEIFAYQNIVAIMKD